MTNVEITFVTILIVSRGPIRPTDQTKREEGNWLWLPSEAGAKAVRAESSDSWEEAASIALAVKTLGLLPVLLSMPFCRLDCVDSMPSRLAFFQSTVLKFI